MQTLKAAQVSAAPSSTLSEGTLRNLSESDRFPLHFVFGMLQIRTCSFHVIPLSQSTREISRHLVHCCMKALFSGPLISRPPLYQLGSCWKATTSTTSTTTTTTSSTTTTTTTTSSSIFGPQPWETLWRFPESSNPRSLGCYEICDMTIMTNWAVLIVMSQWATDHHFSLLNDEQMSNNVRVERWTGTSENS